MMTQLEMIRSTWLSSMGMASALPFRKSTLGEGIKLTIVLDGIVRKEVTINGKGKAKARFKRLAPGDHEVCVDGCEDLCKGFSCPE